MWVWKVRERCDDGSADEDAPKIYSSYPYGMKRVAIRKLCERCARDERCVE